MTKALSPEFIDVSHARLIPWPNSSTHKHSRGRLAVVAGGPLQTGAARLSARAGQRVGAGWVSLFGNAASCTVMAQHETSILVCERELGANLCDQLTSFDAIVIGPSLGLDHGSHEDVVSLISSYLGVLVLDADALAHLANSSEAIYKSLRARVCPAILTPHSGEFVSLFGEFAPSDKIIATLNAARKCNCIVVHKGATTVLANPDGQVFVTRIASPFLATAGTGDVLAGMIGGLCTQGMPMMDACKAALWLHSEAGLRIGAGLIAEDIIVALPAILSEIFQDRC